MVFLAKQDLLVLPYFSICLSVIIFARSKSIVDETFDSLKSIPHLSATKYTELDFYLINRIPLFFSNNFIYNYWTYSLSEPFI